MKRNPAVYLLLLLIVIAAGLGSRRFPELLPQFMRKGVGDALWTTMVFILLGVAWPRALTMRLGAAALAISFAVEFSQLYSAPWIDAIRDTLPGRLILGSGFNASDLVWYTIGAALGVCIESIALRGATRATAEHIT